MARILYLTQILPYPLNTGAKVRQYYVLRHLSRNHAVTLLSFVRPEDQPEHIAHLREFGAAVHTVPMARSTWRNVRAVLKAMLTGLPIVIVRDEIAAMQAQVRRLLETQKIDVIHADQVSMAQYGLLGRGVRRVLDLHNAMYLVTQRLAEHEPNLFKRWLSQRETRALARYEPALLQQYDQVVFVTAEDRGAIEAVSHQTAGAPANVSIIPICVDPSEKQPVIPTANPQRVLFLGPLFWPPNAEGVLWFAREVWQAIHAQYPQARFTVVGRNPPESVAQLHGKDNIEVTGYLPDLATVLAETGALVVPLRAGGGMRVKILDAWCWGLPIVSTSIGAEGINLQDGQNLLLADSPAAFAEKVIAVLQDSQLQTRLRQNGRLWVEQQYDWRRVYSAWDDVYAGLKAAKF